MTRIEGTVALVTGGYRGLGRSLVDALLARGAARVYAAARDPLSVAADDPRVVPLWLDVTSDDEVTAAAAAAGDVRLLVNNTGGLVSASFLGSPVDDVRREFNVHSVLSWLAISGSYSASKAAFWSQTNSLRLELRDRGIGVTGLHSAYIDTDMAAAVDAVEAGELEVLVDDVTRGVKAGLAADVSALYAQLAPS